MNKINYNIANKNQVLRLSELFANVYKKKITEKELVWRYFDNPLQKGKIYNCVATNDDHEIIGHTAFIKNKFYINNKIVYGGLTVGSTVASEYGGIFAPMYSYLEKLIINDFDFLYGFPNQNSFPFFIKLFKYQKIHSNLFQLKNISSNSQKLKLERMINIINIDYLENNSDFLDWRVVNNPIEKYYYYSFKDSKIIWKKYNDDEIDIIAVMSNNIKLSIEKKYIPVTKKINFLVTSIGKINNLIKEGYHSLDCSNTFVIKLFNKSINFDLISFQMLHVDIY